MKIFHIAPYYPPHLGGLQTAVQNLATAQFKAGRDVTVITSKSPKHSTNKRQPQVLRLKVLEIGHTPFMPGLLPAMVKRTNKTDALHLHFAQFYLPEIVAMHYIMRKAPYVFHFHGDVLPSGPLGKLLPYYKKYILPISLRKASVVVFPSTDFQQRMLKQYSFLQAQKTQVIPNGIFLPHNSGETREKRSYFIYVGRLSKIKNVSFIIRAFNTARKRNSKLKLLVTGEGECRIELEKLVKELGEEDSIEFTGRLSQEKLAKLYKNSMALLVASDRESFGLTIVEAMSHGVPVIACSAPGIREIVVNNVNGYTARRTHNSYAECIIKIAKDDCYDTLSENAAKTAKNYALPKIVASFDNLYKEIAVP